MLIMLERVGGQQFAEGNWNVVVRADAIPMLKWRGRRARIIRDEGIIDS